MLDVGIHGLRLGGASPGSSQFSVRTGFVSQLSASDHLFLGNRLLSGGKLCACLAELDGGQAGRVDAFCIGNRLLGCLQVGVRGWLAGPGGGSG